MLRMQMYESRDGVSVWRWRSIAPRVRILKNMLLLTFCVAAGVGASLVPLLTFLASAADLKVLAPLSLLVFHCSSAASHLSGRAVFRLCRHKMAIVMGISPIFFLVVATSFPHETTLISASMLVGLMQGPLWTASFSYMIGMAKQLGHYSDQSDMGTVPTLLSLLNAFIALGEFFGYSLTAGSSNLIERKIAHNRIIIVNIAYRSFHGAGDGRESLDEGLVALRLGGVRSSLLQPSRAETVAVVAVGGDRRSRVGVGQMDQRLDVALDRRAHLQRDALYLLRLVRRLRRAVPPRQADRSNVRSRFAAWQRSATSDGSIANHSGSHLFDLHSKLEDNRIV